MIIIIIIISFSYKEPSVCGAYCVALTMSQLLLSSTCVYFFGCCVGSNMASLLCRNWKPGIRPCEWPPCTLWASWQLCPPLPWLWAWPCREKSRQTAIARATLNTETNPFWFKTSLHLKIRIKTSDAHVYLLLSWWLYLDRFKAQTNEIARLWCSY